MHVAVTVWVCAVFDVSVQLRVRVAVAAALEPVQFTSPLKRQEPDVETVCMFVVVIAEVCPVAVLL